ncbi:NtaA/DmoA family FMN-dependent monooxygenase [Nonomuraea jabiensis]|uniref:NtaA/DmoA family FMN-dependent monooxygenase n=1 Tax=Nonomuraea jabiensis TaxID=882448 RepID=UPI003442E0B8
MKQVHLAAHFPGVNNTTVWADPRSRSQIDFQSFVDLARTAERGKFDFFFLAEGLRLRELKGRIHDLDVVGRPESLTVLAALAAVTERLGLAATVNATFNEPYELARRLATLDHLSAGRAAWNVVTTSDAFTGENFRRGGYLDRSERYTRAQEFVRLSRELWDSWRPDAVLADQESGRFLRPGYVSAVSHRGRHFTVEGRFNVPRSPQGHPVIIQAGDSDEGREFAAANADVIFSRHGTLEGRAFYADVKRRLAAYGRQPHQLKIMPAATFALGDTDAEAAERAHGAGTGQALRPVGAQHPHRAGRDAVPHAGGGRRPRVERGGQEAGGRPPRHPVRRRPGGGGGRAAGAPAGHRGRRAADHHHHARP